jgi:hypothetical protein
MPEFKNGKVSAKTGCCDFGLLYVIGNVIGNSYFGISSTKNAFGTFDCAARVPSPGQDSPIVFGSGIAIVMKERPGVALAKIGKCRAARCEIA